MRTYHGSWRPAEPLLENAPLTRVVGLDLSSDAHDRLHLVYWKDMGSYSTTFRGNLYHLTFDGVSWSAPYTLDQSGLAGYPRTAMGKDDTFYVTWESMAGDRIVARWNEFREGQWNVPRALSLRPSAEAWYPSVNVLPEGQLIFAWSSRSADYVTIEAKSASPHPPVVRLYLPMMSGRSDDPDGSQTTKQ